MSTAFVYSISLSAECLPFTHDKELHLHVKYKHFSGTVCFPYVF